MKPAHRALVAAIIVLLAGAGIGALALRGDSADGKHLSGGPAGADPTASSESQGDPAASDSTTADGVKDKAGADGKATTALRAWRTPQPGTYRYHHERQGDGAEAYDGTFVIAATGRAAYSDSRGRDAFKSTQHFSTDDGSLSQTRLIVDRGYGQESCRWDHPVLLLPAEAKDGHKWTSKAQCTWTRGQDTATTDLESAFAIVGIRDSKVDGATVQLLRVDGKSTVRTTSAGGVVTRTSAFVEYYDTARGLLAQSTEDVTETGPSGTTTYRIVDTMLTTHPEVP